MQSERSYLTYNRRVDLEADKQYFEEQLENPLADKPNARQNLARIEHALEHQAPPIVKGPDLDKIARRAKELEEKFVPAMLSQAEMRQAPPGAIGREMQFQRHFKRDVIEWKNCMRTLHRDSDDPDLSNIERLRPLTSQGNLDNAVIPGKLLDFPSQAYQQNYGQVEQVGLNEFETGSSQERRARLAELREELARLEFDEMEETRKEAGSAVQAKDEKSLEELMEPVEPEKEEPSGKSKKR